MIEAMQKTEDVFVDAGDRRGASTIVHYVLHTSKKKRVVLDAV